MQTSTRNSHNTKVNMMWRRTNAPNRQTEKKQRSIWCSLFGATDRQTGTQMRRETQREKHSSGMKKAQGDTHKTRKQVLARTHTWTQQKMQTSWKWTLKRFLKLCTTNDGITSSIKHNLGLHHKKPSTLQKICRLGIPANLTCHWSWQIHVKRWGYSSLQL